MNAEEYGEGLANKCYAYLTKGRHYKQTAGCRQIKSKLQNTRMYIHESTDPCTYTYRENNNKKNANTNI